ncbi:MAG: hypothetical protein WBN83_10640 [Desulfoprunum sp.]|uniref:hypothetical protein n=1 Tax=Desulfoprunum sp. TaxID=2020866 RepID=UPI00052C3F71|nr:hypothetical protein JT06_03005 [Desulfobulbus sp. Tol-SR]
MEQAAHLQIDEKPGKCQHRRPVRLLQAELVGFDTQQERIDPDALDGGPAIEVLCGVSRHVPAHDSRRGDKTGKGVKQYGGHRDVKISAGQQLPYSVIHIPIRSKTAG